MAGKEDNRIFVGGLSWDITERQLENAFSRFGKIVESQVRYCFSFLNGLCLVAEKMRENKESCENLKFYRSF